MWGISLWVAVLATLISFAAADDTFVPKVSSFKSKTSVHGLFYFDDSPNALLMGTETVQLSTDDGVTWNDVKDFKDHAIHHIEFDPYVKNRAFAFSSEHTHFVTNDKGKSWKKFDVTDNKGSPIKGMDYSSFSYNVADLNMILMALSVCKGGFFQSCKTYHVYTKDGLKTNPKPLNTDASICKFVRTNADFDSLVAPETIVCSKNKLNSFGHVLESSVVKTTNFFKTEEKIEHPRFETGKIIDLRVDSAFLLIVVQKDKFNEMSEVSLIVSKDAKKFEESDLDFEVMYGALIFLDSSPLSIFVSVAKGIGRGTAGEATVYSSDSTGLKYTKLLESVSVGSTTKVENVDGVWYANILSKKDQSGFDNFFDGLYHQRKTISKISIDDGKTWNRLKLVDDDSCKVENGCSLQVQFIASVEKNHKWTTGPTPNILMASATKGEESGMVSDLNTYVSRDGGLTWRFAFKGPSLFNFGDQGNLIVAMAFSGQEKKFDPVENVYFSLDQGQLWQTYKVETPCYPVELITTLDGTGTKFILLGLTSNGNQEILYSLDFSNAFNGKTCGKDDFEKVYARNAAGDSPVCIYGEKESFNRRKQDARCFVNKLFEDVKVTEDPCDCTEFDFECSPYFYLSEKGACVPDNSKILELCKATSKKTVKLPHKQKISGDRCSLGKKSESDFIAETEFKCNEIEGGNNDKDPIITRLSDIDGRIIQYSYVSTGERLADNILLMTDKHVAYASNNGGASFVEVPIKEQLLYFKVGPVPGTVVIVSAEHLYYSDDGANTFNKVNVPAPPARGVQPISFDPQNSKNYIVLSGESCGILGSESCVAYYTEDAGESFTKLINGATTCSYVSQNFNLEETQMIFCTVQEGSSRKLVTTTNYFKDSKTPFDNILAYALKSNFVLVATVTDNAELRAKVTADGVTFADADFPSDFKVEAQTAYTILDSNEHSILMHVTTDRLAGHERGALLKSNSNGTSYVLSLSEVNRNSQGYVDFDRIETLEGVLMANVVNNPSSTENKVLKTEISFNDGSEWAYLAPPAIDSEGKKYPCAGSLLAKCSLNLHGFTERPDYRDTFSSSSAVGVLIGVGNVGETLDSYDNAATFLSTDGGLSWKEAVKGNYMWEFGDRGTILVLVKAVGSTNEILYSTDDGTTWEKYAFADEAVHIYDLATVPTDTARKFVIFAAKEKGNDHTLIYSIDFSNFYKRQCQIDLDNPLKDDFEYWTPKHPESSDNCLFGHETKYLRRAIGHNDCFIGAAPLAEGMKVVKNCTCTRRDYECDYNYYRDSDGTCKLVKGLSPQDRKEQMCSKPDTFQYFEPTGYRKVPLSTCVGGKKFDSWNAQPCPGHEKEFNKYYGREVGNKWIIVVLIPLAVFIGATWFVYDRGIKRNGGFQRFGQIRLNDDDDFQPIEDNSVDVVVNRIVRGGIVVVAGGVAVFKTIRKIDRAMFERLTSALFGRRPGRRNYVRVPDDDDELFGNFDENYDEELEGGADINFEVEDEPEEFTDFVDNEPENADARLFDIDDEENRSQSDSHPLESHEESS